jgi:hypothetical protein
MNLQGSAAKTAETLQSQTRPGRENRFLFNGIAVVHGRLIAAPRLLDRVIVLPLSIARGLQASLAADKEKPRRG